MEKIIIIIITRDDKKKTRTHTHTSRPTYMPHMRVLCAAKRESSACRRCNAAAVPISHIFIYIYRCVCVCVCAYTACI